MRKISMTLNNINFRIVQKFVKHSILTTLLFSIFTVFAEEPCDDLWYSRNFYYDKASYCFASKLGKAIFDNSNCISNKITLSKPTKHRIGQIKQVEKEFNCQVNSKKLKRLNITGYSARKNLLEQPINQGLESSCVGYLGNHKVPLYADRSSNSKVLGYITLGANVFSTHDEVDETNWWFATTISKSGKQYLGWTKAVIFDKCEVMAG